MQPSDHDLLQQYARDGSQPAFAELVRRHVDLVYAAARRQVRSAALAEEVAQSVFIDLSRTATRIKAGTPLVAWLHVTTRRTAIDAIRRETRRHARESAAALLDDMKTPPSSPWETVEPLLDEAVQSLPEADRSAILLRYFENKSLREVGAILGTSEDAAQKRVSRALEQMRTFFLRRGVPITATGLATDLSAHAIQIAPTALSAAISTGLSSLGGAALSTATFEATRIITMTTLQKTLAAAVVVLAIGGGLFQARTIFNQRAELRASRQRNDELANQVRQAREHLELDARQLASTRSRAAAAPTAPADPAMESEMKAWLARFNRLMQIFAQMPEKTIPEMRLLSEEDLMKAVQNADLENESGRPRQREDVLRGLRGQAKANFGLQLFEALRSYIKAHDGRLPSDARELLPFFRDNPYFKASAVDENMLQRYAVVHFGTRNDVPADERHATLIEITSSDEERDQRAFVGVSGLRLGRFSEFTHEVRYALRAFAKANPNTSPPNATQLVPYFNPPLSPGRQTKFLQNAPSLLPP